MKYLIVALIQASDKSKGRLSHKVESFDSVLKIMNEMREFVTRENGEILSIYVKSLKED